jgi:leucyl/phenylalanyl-tRNA--protein transferase
MNETKTGWPIWLAQAISFPHPESADAHGLVAAGGDLSVERLLAAYRQGIFPWTAKPITCGLQIPVASLRSIVFTYRPAWPKRFAAACLKSRLTVLSRK